MIDEPPDEELYHVYPTYGRAHILTGYGCWCKPEMDAEVPNVLVHHEEN